MLFERYLFEDAVHMDDMDKCKDGFCKNSELLYGELLEDTEYVDEMGEGKSGFVENDE